MTVQFKATLTGANPAGVSFDDLYQEIKKQVPMLASPPLFVTRVYVTKSDKKPLKWTPYDSNTSNESSSDYLTSSFLEWVKYCSGISDISGYKIVTMAIDHLNGVSQVLPEYCKEHWQVKEKVYINGPKKKPFPTKASKHYA